MRIFNKWSHLDVRETGSLDGFQIYFVDDDDEVDDALSIIVANKLGVDTETTDLDPLAPGARLILVQIYCRDSNSCVAFHIPSLSWESKEKIAMFLEDTSRLKIFHNAKFDMKWLAVHLNCVLHDRVFCTMIAHQLACCGNEHERHSLAYIAGKFLNIYLVKDLQKSNWAAPQLSDEQIVYGCLDTKHLPELARLISEMLVAQGQIPVSTLEFNAMCGYVEIELTGFYLNVDRWLVNVSRQYHRMRRLEEKISAMLNPMNTLFPRATFKVSSPLQLKNKLRENGIKIPVKKDKATGVEKETTGIDFLEAIKDSHPVIPLLIKYGTVKQLHNAFGMKYLRWVNPITKRIHPNIRQIGPLTGRSSFYDPNLQQIPVLAMYRGCFMAQPGYALIISDYSQVELRILASQSEDPNMIRAFVEGHDLHKFTAHLVFKVALKDVTSIQRRRAKDLNFGIVFGIGPDKFAASSGLSRLEGELLMKDYFKAYAGLSLYLNACRRQGRNEKQSRTASGRLVKYEFKDGDHVAASKAERNGMNTPVQGTSADITKLALGNMIREFKKAKIDAKICHVVHDEIITLVKDDPEIIAKAREIQERVMREAGEAFVTNVPIVVDTNVSYKWKK